MAGESAFVTAGIMLDVAGKKKMNKKERRNYDELVNSFHLIYKVILGVAICLFTIALVMVVFNIWSYLK